MPLTFMDKREGKPVIGLLGGVGAGKSTVAAELAALGCGVVDADAVGHQILREPDVKARLAERFGPDILGSDGEIQRPRLAERAFVSAEATAALNAIMHPRMRRRMAERIEVLRADPAIPAVVLDAALLLETDWQELVTHFVFVSAPAEARARRVAEARGWDRSAWAARENSQKPLDIKAASAEYVVDNSSSLSALREQVRSVFHRIVQSADRP